MQNSPKDPSKRHLLVGTAAATAALVASSAAQAVGGHDHANHVKADKGLIDASIDCVQTGEACLSHCFVLVGQNDTSIANCLKSVAETIAICETFTKLVNLGSKHVNNYAKICQVACDECEKECRKHAKKHRECKDCADACVVMLKALKPLTA